MGLVLWCQSCLRSRVLTGNSFLKNDSSFPTWCSGRVDSLVSAMDVCCFNLSVPIQKCGPDSAFCDLHRRLWARVSAGEELPRKLTQLQVVCYILDTDSEWRCRNKMASTFQGPHEVLIWGFAFECNHELEHRGTPVTCGECLCSCKGSLWQKMHVNSLQGMPGRRECTAAWVIRGALPQPAPRTKRGEH